jgi:hypothetical protein
MLKNICKPPSISAERRSLGSSQTADKRMLIENIEHQIGILALRAIE